MIKKLFSSYIGLQIIYSLVFGLLLLFNTNVYKIEPGIDSSWFFAINYAFANHILWGKNLVFTYGPWGFLIFPENISNNLIYYFFYQAIFSISCSLLTVLFLNSFTKLRRSYFIILIPSIIYILATQPYEWRIFTAAILLLFLALNNKTSIYFFIVAGAVSGFSTTVKFSLGMGILPIIIVACFLTNNLLTISKRLYYSIGSFLLSLFFFWYLYQGKIEGLKEYLSNGLYLYKGYSGAMSLGANLFIHSLAYFVVLFMVMIAWIGEFKTSQNWKKLLILLPAFFVAWKGSVVRQDSHMTALIYFSMFFILILTIYSLEENKFKKIMLYGSLSMIIILLGSVPIGIAPGLQKTATISVSSLKDKLAMITGNFRFNDEYSAIQLNTLQVITLPRQVRQTIGNSSIDFYPTENTFAIANGLNWKPRPVIQSYAAFTPELDSLDYNFFSNNPPEYLLLHYFQGFQTIDNRNILFDEPKTIIKIMDTYDLVGTNGLYSILRLRNENRFGIKTVIFQDKALWDEWLKVPQVDRSILLASVNWDRTIVEKVIRFMFREEPVSLSLKFSDNHIETFRIVPDNAISGLWINPFFSSGTDLNAFFNNQHTKNAQYIRFNGKKYSNSINLRWYKLPFENN